MNTEELTMLLTRIQVLDNRQVDQLTIEAWEPLMANVDYNDAVAAVNAHFRTSGEYLKPVHIIEGAREHRKDEIRRLSRLAQKRIHELGGDGPRWAVGGYVDSSTRLRELGELIDRGDASADAKVRSYIEELEEEQRQVEAGRQAWIAQRESERAEGGVLS